MATSPQKIGNDMLYSHDMDLLTYKLQFSMDDTDPRFVEFKGKNNKKDNRIVVVSTGESCTAHYSEGASYSKNETPADLVNQRCNFQTPEVGGCK